MRWCACRGCEVIALGVGWFWSTFARNSLLHSVRAAYTTEWVRLVDHARRNAGCTRVGRVRSAMRCPPCPRCDRIDQVAKVTGIVAWGTHQSSISNWQSRSSFDEDNDIQLLYTHSERSTTSQSDLARQLAFPKRGLDGAAASLSCVVISLLVFLAIYDVSIKTDTPSDYDTALTIVSIFIFIFVSLIPINIGRYFAGRAEAKKIWSSLYYCFRDDVVFVPHDTTRCAPLDMMRTAILRY